MIRRPPRSTLFPTRRSSDLPPDGQESVGADGAERTTPVVAQAQRPSRETPPNSEELDEEYDPWEPFNERMFELNRRLDRYFLKPAAKVYNKIMPEPFQVLISNGFDNIRFVNRAANSLLQGKWSGAGG